MAQRSRRRIRALQRDGNEDESAVADVGDMGAGDCRGHIPADHLRGAQGYLL